MKTLQRLGCLGWALRADTANSERWKRQGKGLCVLVEETDWAKADRLESCSRRLRFKVGRKLGGAGLRLNCLRLLMPQKLSVRLHSLSNGAPGTSNCKINN